MNLDAQDPILPEQCPYRDALNALNANWAVIRWMRAAGHETYRWNYAG